MDELSELPQEKWDSLLHSIAPESGDARAFLDAIFHASQIADDIADGDDKPGDMALLIAAMFDTVFCNEFFIQHRDALRSVILTSVADWWQSARWEGAGDAHRRMYAFVWREALEAVAVAVAEIVGGFKHALHVRELLAETLHAGQWAEPFKG